MDYLKYGKVIEVVNLDNDSSFVKIRTEQTTLIFVHEQDCCENVFLEDFNFNGKFVGGELLEIKEKSNKPNKVPSGYDSVTYTFYTLVSTNGFLDLRFFGESNGYYSEGVSMFDIRDYHGYGVFNYLYSLSAEEFSYIMRKYPEYKSEVIAKDIKIELFDCDYDFKTNTYSEKT